MGPDDKTILADSLLTEKSVAKYYSDSVLESSTPDVRRDLLQIHSEQVDAAHRIWQQMNEKGYYSVRRAEPSVVQRMQGNFGGQQQYGQQYGQQQYGQQYGQQPQHAQNLQQQGPYGGQQYGWQPQYAQNPQQQGPYGGQQYGRGMETPQNLGGRQAGYGYAGSVGSRLRTPETTGGWFRGGRDVGYGPGEGRTTGVGYGPGEEISRTSDVGPSGGYGPNISGQRGYATGYPTGYGAGMGRGYQGSVGSRLLSPGTGNIGGPQGGYNVRSGRDVGYVGYGPGEGRTTGVGFGPGEEISRTSDVGPSGGYGPNISGQRGYTTGSPTGYGAGMGRGYQGSVGSRLLSPGTGNAGGPQAGYNVRGGREVGYVGYGPGEGRTTGVGFGPGEEISRTSDVGPSGGAWSSGYFGPRS